MPPRGTKQRSRTGTRERQGRKIGKSPDEIVAEHPGLTLADVYAALTYHYDHRARIDADIRADEEFTTDFWPNVRAYRHFKLRVKPHLGRSKYLFVQSFDHGPMMRAHLDAPHLDEQPFPYG